MTYFDLSDFSILLVEPSSTQNKVIRNHLYQEGITNVEGVDSGHGALLSVEQNTPDLVISAMYLPDMTAVELVAKIRGRESANAVPFMLISSETRYGALEPIRQSGVVAILPKPFNHLDLKRALRSTAEFIDPTELDLENIDINALQVLVVDDSAMARKHIMRVLANLGISKFTQAVNGKEAAAIYADSNFDLVVTDFNMPEMDGDQLVECIRKEMGDTETPILMVTSEQDMTRLSNVEQAGVSAICDKPFEPQNVREILARVISQITSPAHST